MRRLSTLAVSAIALVAMAGTALAATGDLTPKGCFGDATTGCGNKHKAKGLTQAHYVTVSPDGKSVYAASLGDNSLVTFQRNKKTGTLKSTGCFEDETSGTGDCKKTAPGLDNATSVTVSPDNKFVYLTSADLSTVSWFARKKTGKITHFVDCIGPQGFCSTNASGLGSPYEVAISSNGKSAYVADFFGDSLVDLDRNKNSGALSQGSPSTAHCFSDAALTGCTTTTGLDAASSVGIADGTAATPEGAVYVTGYSDGAISAYTRDTSTGDLTFFQCYKDNDTGTDAGCTGVDNGLDQARSLGFSADGKYGYAASQGDSALISFIPVIPGGAFTSYTCLDDIGGIETCVGEVAGLGGAADVAVSPDGKSLYTAAHDDSAVGIFKENNGATPTAKTCIDDQAIAACDTQAKGLSGAISIAVSPDSKSVYVAAYDAGAIAVFKRAK